MLDWDDFKCFSAVARIGSVRGAGKELGVNASTVTRRLEQFEGRLGVRLFARTRAGLVITPEGAEVVQALAEVGERLAGIERRLKGRDAAMRGPVRVNIPEILAPDLFVPALGAFAGQYPEVVVELGRSWQAPDLDLRAGDLSVVVTDKPPEHLVGRPLGSISLAAYHCADGAPELRDRWLVSALERAVASDSVGRAFPRRLICGFLDSIELQLAAVLAGIGATLLPTYLGDRQARLIRLPQEARRPQELRRELWLLSHPDRRGVARIQAVAETLLEALRGQNLDTGTEPGSEADTTRTGDST